MVGYVMPQVRCSVYIAPGLVSCCAPCAPTAPFVCVLQCWYICLLLFCSVLCVACAAAADSSADGPLVMAASHLQVAVQEAQVHIRRNKGVPLSFTPGISTLVRYMSDAAAAAAVSGHVLASAPSDPESEVATTRASGSRSGRSRAISASADGTPLSTGDIDVHVTTGDHGLISRAGSLVRPASPLRSMRVSDGAPAPANILHGLRSRLPSAASEILQDEDEPRARACLGSNTVEKCKPSEVIKQASPTSSTVPKWRAAIRAAAVAATGAGQAQTEGDAPAPTAFGDLDLLQHHARSSRILRRVKRRLIVQMMSAGGAGLAAMLAGKMSQPPMVAGALEVQQSARPTQAAAGSSKQTLRTSALSMTATLVTPALPTAQQRWKRSKVGAAT